MVLSGLVASLWQIHRDQPVTNSWAAIQGKEGRDTAWGSLSGVWNERFRGRVARLSGPYTTLFEPLTWDQYIGGDNDQANEVRATQPSSAGC